MRKKVRTVSVLLAGILLMSSTFAAPIAAGQGNGRGQEKQRAQQVQYLDAEIQVIDGQPMLKVETKEGYASYEFPWPEAAIVDGREVTLERQGNYFLLQTGDGTEKVSIEDFQVALVAGQLMLLMEVNPAWLIPIAAVVKAALTKAGVAITTVSLYVGGRLLLAGIAISRTTVAAGKALRNAGMSITRTNIDRVLRAKPLITQKLRAAGQRVTDAIIYGTLAEWLAGICIMPWCLRPARTRASFTLSQMVCVHFPRYPCFLR